jgi:hypothetical protein
VQVDQDRMDKLVQSRRDIRDILATIKEKRLRKLAALVGQPCLARGPL